MACIEVQKVQFGIHMLLEEAEVRWHNVHQRPEAVGTEITWVVFRTHFLETYFLKDMCGKEIKFLELKQGNSIVAEYVVKFEELVKFCPHYNSGAAKGSKCIKSRADCVPRFSNLVSRDSLVSCVGK